MNIQEYAASIGKTYMGRTPTWPPTEELARCRRSKKQRKSFGTEKSGANDLLPPRNGSSEHTPEDTKNPKTRGVTMAGVKFPYPVDMTVIDQQIMTGVVNHYKMVIGQVDKASQDFRKAVVRDLGQLLQAVPELKDYLVVGDDFYELIDPEPPDESEPDGINPDVLSPNG